MDEATVGPVLRICGALDGMPLALELAARVRALFPQQIAARLGDRFRQQIAARLGDRFRQQIAARLGDRFRLLASS